MNKALRSQRLGGESGGGRLPLSQNKETYMLAGAAGSCHCHQTLSLAGLPPLFSSCYQKKENRGSGSPVVEVGVQQVQNLRIFEIRNAKPTNREGFLYLGGACISPYLL